MTQVKSGWKYFFFPLLSALCHQLFRPVDYFLLVVTVKIDKIVGIPGDADEQVAVVIRGLLRFSQRRGIDHVELDVMSAETEIGAYE